MGVNTGTGEVGYSVPRVIPDSHGGRDRRRLRRCKLAEVMRRQRCAGRMK